MRHGPFRLLLFSGAFCSLGVAQPCLAEAEDDREEVIV